MNATTFVSYEPFLVTHNPSAFASLWLWEGTSIGLVAFLAAVYLAVFLFAFYALRKLHATQQQHLQTPVTRRRRRRRQGQGNSTARRKRWSRYRQNMWNTFDIAYSGDDDHPADYGSSGEEYRQYNEWVKDTIHPRPRTRSVTEALAQAGHAVPFGVLSPAARPSPTPGVAIPAQDADTEPYDSGYCSDDHMYYMGTVPAAQAHVPQPAPAASGSDIDTEHET